MVATFLTHVHQKSSGSRALPGPAGKLMCSPKLRNHT